MKKLFILLAFASCTKADVLLPVVNEPGKIETRDLIDQNFFLYGTNPEIEIKYCLGGSVILEATPPPLNGSFETVYTYEWGFIRCKGCGADTDYNKKIEVKLLSGTNAVVKVQGFRVGTNIKSDFYYASIKIK